MCAEAATVVAASPAGVNASLWKRNLAVLWCGQFLVTASLTVIVPLVPFYLEELGATNPAQNRAWTGWVLAAPAFTLVFAAPLWGRLGDRLGRKWMVVRALFGIALSVLAMGLAETPAQLFVFRLVQGAFGGVDDAAAAFANTQVPPAQQGRALGVLQTATAGGALVGPLAGAFLSSSHGFGPVVLVLGALVALCGLVAARTLEEGPRPRAVAAGVAPPTGTALAGILEDPGSRSFLIAGLLVQVGAYGIIGVFAVHVRALLFDPNAAIRWVGALQALTWAMTFVGAAFWGHRNDRRSPHESFVIAAVICGASVGLQAWPQHPGWLAPLRAGQGFCHSALGQTVYLQLARNAPIDQRGLRIGVANSFLTAGQVLGALCGASIAARLSPGVVLVAMSGCFLAAAVLVAIARGAPLRSEGVAK
jgi:MFS transporter, DHA1 family, staphyloferrin B biosynthesis exporter